jgi:hypothetical protein
MSEQLAMLVSCSSQAAPGSLSDDDASPIPGLAGPFRPQIRLRSFVALKVPHMTHPWRGEERADFSRGCGEMALAGAVGQKGLHSRVIV